MDKDQILQTEGFLYTFFYLFRVRVQWMEQEYEEYKVQRLPPWPERQVEVLAQVEDVEGQPAHNEEEQGGQQQMGPPHIAPLTQHPSAQDNQGYWEYRGFYQNWQARVQVNSDKVK